MSGDRIASGTGRGKARVKTCLPRGWTPFAESLGLLGSRRFGTFFFATLLSNVGTWAQLVAEPWLREPRCCQSARKKDPGSALKRDALGIEHDAWIPPAELVGVAQRGGIDVQGGRTLGLRRGS